MDAKRGVLLMSLNLLGSACGGGGGGDSGDGGAGETGGLNQDPCTCDPLDDYACSCYVLGEWVHHGYVCGSDESGGENACDTYCDKLPFGPYLGSADGPIGCAGQTGEVSCSSWEPAEEIDYDAGEGVYLLDLKFVSALVADPEPLSGCDDATVLLSDHGFVVGNADSGEFLHEIGLRDGDLIVRLNDIALETYADVGFSFAYLWLTNRETSYTVEIERDSVSLALDYRLVDTTVADGHIRTGGR